MPLKDVVTSMISDKRRWRAYKARTRALPAPYREAVDAIERYVMHVGPADGDSAASMFEDLAELFERAAADGTPIADVVGDDPLEFVDTFLENYVGGGWVGRERARLVRSIEDAEKGQQS